MVGTRQKTGLPESSEDALPQQQTLVVVPDCDAHRWRVDADQYGTRPSREQVGKGQGGLAEPVSTTWCPTNVMTCPAGDPVSSGLLHEHPRALEWQAYPDVLGEEVVHLE